MSIATEITRLNGNLDSLSDAKTAIASAITTKGGTVASGDGFADFATDIASIPSGGGGVTTLWSQIVDLETDLPSGGMTEEIGTFQTGIIGGASLASSGAILALVAEYQGDISILANDSVSKMVSMVSRDNDRMAFASNIGAYYIRKQSGRWDTSTCFREISTHNGPLWNNNSYDLSELNIIFKGVANGTTVPAGEWKLSLIDTTLRQGVA